MKGYEGSEQPFIVSSCCVSGVYADFMKGEGLLTIFIGVQRIYQLPVP